MVASYENSIVKITNINPFNLVLELEQDSGSEVTPKEGKIRHMF